MAHFRGTLAGNRGEASRLGTARSGLRVTANGWSFGVTVTLLAADDGHDFAAIYLTSGSNGGAARCLGVFNASDLAEPKKATP